MGVARLDGVSSKGIDELRQSSSKRTQLDRDDFMKLFVTQLQYQDPMNPMESAEMATQVAQFNMVDLLYKSNNALKSLVSATKAGALTDAVAFLGTDVTYKGYAVELGEEGGSVSVEIEAESPSKVTTVMVADQSGRIVKTVELGALSGGRKEFVWDGTGEDGERMPPGIYEIRVRAVDAAGEEVSTTVWTHGIVTGLRKDQDGNVILTLNTGETTNLTDIEKVGR